MENAAEALKLAGFTLLFVVALSVAMTTIMQAKRTSEQIITYSDKTNYSSTIDVDTSKQNEDGNRIVTVYDIIPTLYRYSQEKYIVLFEKSDGSPLTVIKSVPIIIDNTSNTTDISYLNIELETYMHTQWLGTTTTIKEHVNDVVENLLNQTNKTKTYIESLSTTNNAYKNNGDIRDEKNVETPIKVITYRQQ